MQSDPWIENLTVFSLALPIKVDLAGIGYVLST